MSRISLRKLKIKDLVLFCIYRRDADVSRWTSEPAKASILGRIGNVSNRLYQLLFMIVANTLQLRKTKVYRYAVILSETDIMVGVISVTMLTKDRTGADIGYWLGKKYWGMGLMTEALSLATERVFFDLGVKYLSAWTYDANSGSKKVLEKCGFTLCKVYKDRYIIEGKSHDRLEYILNACDSKVTQKAENES